MARVESRLLQAEEKASANTCVAGRPKRATTLNAVVFGANGGIGSALARGLAQRSDDKARYAYETVFGVARQPFELNGVVPIIINAYDDESLKATAAEISAAGPPTLCICATGLLSGGSSKRLKPEKSYKQQTAAAFEEVFFANTIIPALIAKHFLPIMPRRQRAVFGALSARVGSISDNGLGGWHAYRASKAALNMLIKNYGCLLYTSPSPRDRG